MPSVCVGPQHLQLSHKKIEKDRGAWLLLQDIVRKTKEFENCNNTKSSGYKLVHISVTGCNHTPMSDFSNSKHVSNGNFTYWIKTLKEDKRLTESNLERSCCKSQGLLSTKEKRGLIRIQTKKQTALSTKIITPYVRILFYMRGKRMGIKQKKVCLPVEHVLQAISQLMHSPVSGSSIRPETHKTSNNKGLSIKVQPTHWLCFTFLPMPHSAGWQTPFWSL